MRDVVTLLTAAGALIGGWYGYQTFQAQQKAFAETTVGLTEPGTLSSDRPEGCTTVVPQSGIRISGTVHKERDEQIWLLVHARETGRYYLQSGTEISVGPRNTWSLPTREIGGPGDGGWVRFGVLVVAADLNAASTMARAYNQPLAPGDAPYVESIPAGAYPVFQGCVLRR